jgi:hypothetical protein
MRTTQLTPKQHGPIGKVIPDDDGSASLGTGGGTSGGAFFPLCLPFPFTFCETLCGMPNMLYNCLLATKRLTEAFGLAWRHMKDAKGERPRLLPDHGNEKSRCGARLTALWYGSSGHRT